MVAREENMGDDDNQSLIDHAKKGKSKMKEYYHKNRIFPKKGISQLRCFTSDEKWHFTRDCPKKKGINKRHHAHITKDDEPFKKKAKEENSSDE